MEKIVAGEVIARFVVDMKKWNPSLKKARAAMSDAMANIKKSITAAGDSLDQLAGKLDKAAGDMGMLAGAIFVPIIASMKSFAEKNEEAKTKLSELRKELETVPQFDFVKRNQIQAQMAQLQQVTRETGRARFMQDRLVNSFQTLYFEIGKLLWEALGPYVQKIIEMVKMSILWINTNKEFVKQIAIVIAKFGALMAVLAPVMAIGGKLTAMVVLGIKILTLLLSPLGLIIAVFTGIYLLFKDQINPVISEHLEVLKQLWEQWKTGAISTQEAIGKLGEILLSFVNETLKAVGAKINATVNEWTSGWMNKLVEDGFYYILRGLDILKDGATKAWDWIVGKFEWASQKITGVMDTLRAVWDKAVGHSWWTDALSKMSRSTTVYMGQTAGIFAARTGQIIQSMSMLSRATGAINRQVPIAMRGGAARGFAISGGGASSVTNQFNIGINGGQLASELRAAVHGTVKNYVRRTILASG